VLTSTASENTVIMMLTLPEGTTLGWVSAYSQHSSLDHCDSVRMKFLHYSTWTLPLPLLPHQRLTLLVSVDLVLPFLDCRDWFLSKAFVSNLSSRWVVAHDAQDPRTDKKLEMLVIILTDPFGC